jgi:hypothetical protein
MSEDIRFEVGTVDDCLDALEAAFLSDMWKQLPEQDRRRLVNRLYIILRDIGEGSKQLWQLGNDYLD